MSPNVRKGFLWGGAVLGLLLVFRLVMEMLNFLHTDSPQPERVLPGKGHGYGHRRGPEFEPHHVMLDGAHHGGDVFWLGLFLIAGIILAAAILFVKWKRRKIDSFQQFVNVPLTTSTVIVNESNAGILDTWEKNQTKKENE